MPKLRQVDASQVCDELLALCNAAECFLSGTAPQGHKRATTHAQCLYQLLGDSPDSIVAKSGNSLTTTFLRELSQDIPWRFIVMGADLSSECEPLAEEQIELLRRWLELIRNSELPQREYTDEKIPKGLLISALKLRNDDAWQRVLINDPLLVHPDQRGTSARNIRFDVDALRDTEIYNPAQRSAAILEWKKRPKAVAPQ